jgi:hypothetical protein
MTKCLPPDALVMLHNRLSSLTPRDPKRRLIIQEASSFYGISVATIYRSLHKHSQIKAVHRRDYNQPRSIPQKEMKGYCEIIAALKIRTTNKKGRHLSTKECIRLLEDHGVETPDGLIKPPKSLLKRATIDLYLKRFGLSQKKLNIQPACVRFEAAHSNDCWQFDFSPSDFKHFPDDKLKYKSQNLPTLMLVSVVDDRSGVMYQEYHYVYGEDTMTGLKFLFNAMSLKKHPGFPFQGIPKMLYLDNGPLSKSNTFKRVMAHLNIEVQTHLPDGKDGRRKTARSKGKVERPFRTVKESLETLYHLHPPKNLDEANEWLLHYLKKYNNEKHRRESHSRLEDWRKNLPPEGFRAMCDWKTFSSMARAPEMRKVASDACVTAGGVNYQVSSELAGLTVTLLWGIFDHELRVEHEGRYYGPFYPTKGPIPLGQYRSLKKSQTEVRADHISELAKKISIPRQALNPKEFIFLHDSGLTQETLNSVPFLEKNCLEDLSFGDSVEAKAAIARFLGFPLGRLSFDQLAKINQIVAKSLDKKEIMSNVKQLFSPKLIISNKRGD